MNRILDSDYKYGPIIEYSTSLIKKCARLLKIFNVTNFRMILGLTCIYTSLFNCIYLEVYS